MGCFSQPSDLRLRAAITFPSREMANAFVKGLQEAGYSPEDIYCGCSSCNTISFTFDHSPRVYGLFRRMRVRLAQLCNRLFCRLYLFVTRPFEASMDRILYLYFYLPFALRRALRAGKKQRRSWRTARKRDAKYNRK